MGIKQGEIYWINLEEPLSSGSGYRHPYVVVQNNLFNQSRINTVVVCDLTTNLRRADVPGNILLDAGEVNLPRQSVINISQIFTVDKSNLGECVGTLSPGRIRQIVDCLFFIDRARRSRLTNFRISLFQQKNRSRKGCGYISSLFANRLFVTVYP